MGEKKPRKQLSWNETKTILGSYLSGKGIPRKHRKSRRR